MLLTTVDRVDTEWLEKKRQEAGWSLSRMARQADLSTETVWRTLSGRTQPTRRVAEALAAALGVPVGCLYGHPADRSEELCGCRPPNGGVASDVAPANEGEAA